MGTVCGTEERVFRKLEEYLHPDSLHSPFIAAPATHSRFGNIEKIRTRKSDVFKLIMATSDAKMQTVSIDCRILESTAEFQLYEGTKFQLQDRAISPVIDIFCSNEAQVYHPIKTAGKHNLTLKAYPFSGYSDSVLKRAIYEIWICGQLRAGSPLVDHFIMSRGKANTVVMLCKNYECSLLEVVRYRQLADYHWSEAEVVSLWKMLISNYRQLSLLSICHRDIRLGKIFYIPDDRTKPFQFANLSTARKITRAQASDLLTVVGVAPFAEPPLREKIESGEEVAMYDPFNYDISCLVRVLLSILNLDPLEKESLTCNNARLAPIIQKLREGSSLEEVERELQAILRTLTFERETLFREDRIISEHLSRSQLRRKNRERIQECYFNTLLQTHKKEAFNRLLLERMEQNEVSGNPQLNISLLHKVGEYYVNVGLDRNQYFQEEFRLLLDLAKQSRQEDFSQQHDDYLGQAGKLQELIPKENGELRVRYSMEVVYKFMEQGKLESAGQRLTSLLDLSSRMALHINPQLDVLITKARLELQGKQLQAAESTVEKIGNVVGTNDFQTVHDAKKYQGELQLLRGRLQLLIMNSNYQEIKKKRLALTEVSLNNALSIFTNLPESPSNTATIVQCHLARAELAELKEDYPEAKRSLDSADILLSQLEKTRPVSSSIRERVLLGLKRVYQRSNRASEPAYKATLDRLSKIANKPAETNALRLQRNKEMKARERMRSKQERMMTNELAIEELIEEEQV